MQSRVIEQRAGRAQPAVEVHHLVVCIYIVELCNLSDPPNHHAFQDSTGNTGRNQVKQEHKTANLLPQQEPGGIN